MEDSLIITGHEDEIAEYNAQLSSAMESLETHLHNMDRLQAIYVGVLEHGVSRAAMESLHEIYPKAMPAAAHPGTFTVKPSQINMEYAVEGFWSAVGEAIKWVFKQIIEALKALGKLIVAMVKWLFDIREQRVRGVGGKKEAERLLSRARHIHDRWDELYPRYMSEISEDRRKNIPLTSIPVEEHFLKHFNTQLDHDILAGSKGFSIEVILSVAEAILSGMDNSINVLDDALQEFKDIFTRPAHIDEVYLHLQLLKELVSVPYFKVDDKYVNTFLPYSYTEMFKMIEHFSSYGKDALPYNVEAYRKRDHQKPIWFVPERVKGSDDFWKGYVGDAAGNRLTPISWSRELHCRVYSAGLDQKINLKYDFKSFTDQHQKFIVEKKQDLDKRADEISDSINSVEQHAEVITKKDIGELHNVWYKKLGDSNYNSRAMVWPQKNGTYRAGDIIAGHQQDSTDFGTAPGLMAQSLQSTLGNASGYWTAMIKPAMFLNGPFKDVMEVINRYLQIIEYQLKYLHEKEKDNGRMENALND